MELYFLGTCAGTEPMPNRKHASFVINVQNRLYWFDAGESCSQTAHIMGLDLLSVNKIIISHTHMDHVGGLGNLLWNIRKLSIVKKQTPRFGDLDLFIPNMQTWDGIWKILENTEGGFHSDFSIHPQLVTDGLLFDDGILSVTAYHNHHLQKKENVLPWLSFTYRIESAGQSIVYSGDVGDYTDMDAAIGDGCDALIVETGHLRIDGVYDYTRKKNIGKVFFHHCGREFLNHPKESAEKIQSLFGTKAIICEDQMHVVL